MGTVQRDLPGRLSFSPPARLLWITGPDDFGEVLPQVIRYVAGIHARLMLLHIVPDAADASSPSAWEGTAAERLLEEASTTARAAGVECDWHVERSTMDIALQQVTDSWNPDRILRVRCAALPDHELDMLTESVLREASVPVLVVRAGQIPARSPSPSKILLPTSLGRRSLQVVSSALLFAALHGAETTMLHVIEGEDRLGRWSHRVQACAMARFEEVLEKFEGLPIETRVAVGSLPETVSQIASAEASNLILLGISSGISFRGDVCPGPAYKILCMSPCPVLVCKHDLFLPSANAEYAAQRRMGTSHLP